MRSILVLAGGRTTDGVVFETALAAANPLHAHLEFLHVRPDPGEAALYAPHVDFARGAAIESALGSLKNEGKARAAAALHHFEALCEKEAIDIAIRPGEATAGRRCASWSEERRDAVGRIMHFARHNDLVVIGRHNRSNGLPPDLVERVLVDSGRPVLIAPSQAPQSVTGIVLVCWKETAESARALTAALPLLAVSRRVVLVTVEEETEKTPEAIGHLAQRLEWDGIKAETKWLRASEKPVEQRLESLAFDLDADLLVMGGYGHGRMREMVFGGCTRHFLEQAERPVLMVH